MNFSILNTILIGIGLGLLLLSCFVTCVLFGNYANSFNGYEKLVMKVSNDKSEILYKISIAIAVLGIATVVASIITIIFSFIFESNIILLLILGGITALLALGCIISEGFYYGNAPYYIIYQNKDFRGKPNKDVQKYITGAIEELYNHALDLIKEKYSYNYNVEDIKIWSDLVNKISDEKFKYTNIWHTYEPYTTKDYLQLYIEDGFIKAKWNNIKQTVASLKFNDQTIDTSLKDPKIKVCWPKSVSRDPKNQLKCKKIESGISVTSHITDQNDMLYLNEIIETQQYEFLPTTRDTLTVKKFPVCYSLMTSEEIYNCEESATYVSGQCTYYDSTSQYKVSGKNLLKQIKKRWIKNGVFINNDYDYSEDDEFSYTFSPIENDDDKNKFFFSINEIKTYDDIKRCNSDKEQLSSQDEFYNYFCHTYDSVSDLLIPFQNGTSSQRERIDSSIAKKYISESVPSITRPEILYRIALIEMIVQILGIVFWACGRFLGFILKSSDDQSANEVA